MVLAVSRIPGSTSCVKSGQSRPMLSEVSVSNRPLRQPLGNPLFILRKDADKKHLGGEVGTTL
jgi:hypothetical protein